MLRNGPVDADVSPNAKIHLSQGRVRSLGSDKARVERVPARALSAGRMPGKLLELQLAGQSSRQDKRSSSTNTFQLGRQFSPSFPNARPFAMPLLR